MKGLNFHDWEKENELTARFIGKYKDVGKFKRGVYVFRAVTGKKIIHTWDYYQLIQLFRDIPFGTVVKVCYLGLQPMPDRPTNKFKAFSLEIIIEEKKK